MAGSVWGLWTGPDAGWNTESFVSLTDGGRSRRRLGGRCRRWGRGSSQGVLDVGLGGEEAAASG